VSLVVTFWLPAPKRAIARLRRGVEVRCDVRPDQDKLLRGLFDALTGVLYVDDGQADLSVLRKRYAWGEHPAGVDVAVSVNDAGGIPAVVLAWAKDVVVEHWRRDVVAFCTDCFGVDPSGWQADVLRRRAARDDPHHTLKGAPAPSA
jgi:hypothetical protein